MPCELAGIPDNLVDVSGSHSIKFMDKKFLNLDVDIGSVVDLSKIQDSVNYNLAIDGWTDGDVYIITGKGSTGGARLYAFLDASSKLMNVADRGAVGASKRIVAPEGAMYLIAHVDSDGGTLVKLNRLGDEGESIQRQATFDVSEIASEGDKVIILHYNEEANEWEYIGEDTVSENGTVTGDFTSFSPVAFVSSLL